MEGRFLKYRWQKVGLIVLAISIVITLFLVFFLDSLLVPIVSRKIKNGIIKSSDSLYHVQFDKLSLQVLKGDALLEGVTLMPDTAVFSRMKRQGRAPAMLYSGKVKQLEISGLHPLLYYFKKKLEIGKISLLDPELTVKIEDKSDKPQPKKAPSTLYEKIAGSLKMIHVDLISLEHTRLSYQDLTGQKPASYHLKDLSLQATDLLIDSASQKDSLRTLFCKNIEASITNFTGTSEDHLYRYRLKRATFSTQNANLRVTGIMVQPLAPQAFFAKSNGDRFSLLLDSIILTHLNYRTFMFDKYLEVKKLTFSKGSFSVYSNPHGKLQSTDRIVTFPNYVIRKITTIFNIDTLDIRKLNVDYSEFNNQSKKTGFISFKQTNARFLNITNQKIRLRQNAFCTVRLSTYFMGRGKLDLSFLFNLDDQDYNYSYQGHLGPMPLDAINPAVMPLSLVSIQSGQLNSFDFNIHSTQKKSTGTVNLRYSNLDVHLLGSGEGKGYHQKALKTFLANTLIIKHDNPDKGSDAPRSAKVVFIRPKNFPFFKTAWLTLLSGIKPCAGIGYAVKQEAGKSLTKEEQKAKEKALKKARKNKEKEDRKYRKKLKKQEKISRESH